MLLSGFEAFAGDARNPSLEATQALHGETVLGHQLVALALPTTFAGAWPCLQRAIEQLRPAVVIATGLAGGRTDISIERFALNFVDARIPDNRGDQPRDSEILSGGPVAYASTLPVARIIQQLRAAGVPASASLSAGAYVCNQLYYQAAHALAATATRLGFIHVPYASEHVLDRPGTPSLALATIIDALRLAVAASLQPD